jgi:hypothetical protein
LGNAGRGYMGNVVVDGNTLRKQIFEKYGVKVWNQLNWLYIVYNGRHLKICSSSREILSTCIALQELSFLTQ